MTSSLDELDPTLTAPKRLSIVALLSRATDADFTFLRDHLGVSDSDLSKQMAALVAAGHVSARKSGRGRGSVTSYAITRHGRRTYERHRAALRAILAE